MQMKFSCQGWDRETKKKWKRKDKDVYRDILRDRKKRPAERQRGWKWWMWGSQQRYILYLCLALSPLSAAKCQCQSNLCSAGTGPSTSRLADAPLESLSSMGTTTLTWHNAHSHKWRRSSMHAHSRSAYCCRRLKTHQRFMQLGERHCFWLLWMKRAFLKRLN